MPIHTFPNEEIVDAVKVGVAGTVPLPLTGTFTVAAPPPALVTLPDLGPAVCGVNRTHTFVADKVAEVYARVVLAPQVLLSLDTWKSDEGADTVITPGAPVRLAPDKLYDCDVEFVPISTFPKSAIVPVTVKVGVGADEHNCTGDALFLGAGAPVEKSALLLSVSVHPLSALKPASVALTAGAAPPPSKQAAVP